MNAHRPFSTLHRALRQLILGEHSDERGDQELTGLSQVVHEQQQEIQRITSTPVDELAERRLRAIELERDLGRQRQ